MISHSNGDAAYHREQRGIKTPEQKRIEQLEAELVSLALEKQMRQMAEQSNVKLLAELAECKRDAERYRWLKDNPNVGGFGWCVPDWEEYFTGDLDEAIDAAIAAMGEKK